jgi:uroporphyrinogen-III synthase
MVTRQLNTSDRAGPWRVAVTRDEPADGPATRALRAHGFQPVRCPATTGLPAADPAALRSAAAQLDGYDWLVCSSVRAVQALAQARERPWPCGLRTAAAGEQTARALLAAGADPPPFIASAAGAAALVDALVSCDTWTDRRVLVVTVPGGRRDVIEGLRRAGALVDEVESYRTGPRDPALIREDWCAGRPHAAVVASPSAAEALVSALGADALNALGALVAIGPTTAAALAALGVASTTPARADFEAAAEHLAGILPP